MVGLYPNKSKNREFADAESPRFDSEKTGPLFDIGAVFSEPKMGLSAKAKTDSSTCLGITRALSCITPKKIVVIGDLLLDQYTFGVTKRISPEAPVPVLHVNKEEFKAGGAGNVALNLVTLGMNVTIVGRVGHDNAGEMLLSTLKKEGVDIAHVIHEKGFCTPTKIRCIAGAQQLLRIDHEESRALSEELEEELLSHLPMITHDADLIAVSDYAKGFLTDRVLRAVIDLATMKGIPCIVDPKASDFQKYAGCTILKPNESETMRAAPDQPSLESAAFDLLKKVPVNVLMVTRSEAGITLFYPSGKGEHYPVTRKEVRDSTGSGDIVLAMMSAALACHLSLQEAVPLANIAAAIGVETIGCARISLQHIAKHLFHEQHREKVCSGKSFANILDALHSEKLLLIQIPPHLITPESLVKLTSLARAYPDRRAIACFEEEILDPKLLELIASLEPLSFVVHGFQNGFQKDVLQLSESPHHISVSF